MLNFLKKRKLQSGALLDTRPQAEKEKDVQFGELVAAANPVSWVEKSSWRKFPIFNQNGSGSCVAQTMAKLLGILYYLKNGDYVHFSATDIYQRRYNKPASGMNGANAFDIASQGTTLEVLAPSQNMHDAEMDAVKIEQYKRDVGSVFKSGTPIFVPMGDIEKVASVIQTTKKGVMVWFFFKYEEWTDEPTLSENISLENALNTPGYVYHSVAAVDFLLKNGKKYLVIEDSWGPTFGMGGQRLISEEFFKARNYFAAYTMNFKFDQVAPVRPQHTFNSDLKFGITNEDVKALQDILKFETLFPANVDSTGYYGSVTAQAVLAFQQKYGVPDDGLVGKIVGPKTRAKLNELYG